MSECWDIRCFECGDGAGFSVDHGERRLYEIIEAIPLFPASNKVIFALDNLFHCDWECNGDSGPSISELFAFSVKHAGHKLKLHNGYVWDDQCREQWSCGSCKTTHLHCKKHAAHEGDHGP